MELGQIDWPYVPCVSDIFLRDAGRMTVVTGVTFELYEPGLQCIFHLLTERIIQ